MYMENPLVSVIVPVYNGQKTVERCIDSILNQTFRNFELIVINDGSTDNTENILLRYTELDVRLILITQENKGVSVARNVGMDHAIGKWITFVDADDYLEKNCLESVLASANIDKYGLVFWNYYRVKPCEKEAAVIFHQSKGEYNIEELLPFVFYNGRQLCLCTVYCKLFQRELILNNQLHFQEGIVMYEDRLFLLDYLMCTEKSLGLEKHLYNRILNADSVIHCWHQNAKEEYLFATTLLKEKLLNKEIWNVCQNSFNIWILQDCITQYLETYLCHSRNIADRKSRKEELYVFINEKIIAEAIKKIKYRDLPIKSRVKFVAIKHRWIGLLDRWYRNKDYFI